MMFVEKGIHYPLTLRGGIAVNGTINGLSNCMAEVTQIVTLYVCQVDFALNVNINNPPMGENILGY